MKKIILSAIATALIVISFTSCKDKGEEEILPPMLGYWKCTGIGGSVLGASTTSIGEDYLKYFSVSYAGIGTSGYYARVGISDIEDLATITNIDKNTWKSFLSAGSYTYDATAGTITHSATNGESRTYNYTVMNDGKTLKLVEQKFNLSSSSTVNNALDILNSFLGTSATTSVGVEYTYEKLSGEEAFNTLSSINK